MERAAAADRQAIAHVKRNAQALKADGRSPFFPELYYEPDEARRASKMAAIIEQVRAKRDQQGKSGQYFSRQFLTLLSNDCSERCRATTAPRA